MQSLLSRAGDAVPPFVANLPNQVETIIVTGKLDPALQVDIVVKTISDDAAKEVASTIRMGVGKAVGAMGVLGQAAEDTMGPDAAGKLTSVLGELLTSIQPQVDGDEIRISIIAPDGTNALLDEIAKFIKQELTPTDGFKDETERDAVFSDDVAKDDDIMDEAEKDGFRSDEKR